MNTENPVSATRWILAPGVFYRLAGPQVYVRNVATRYDYLFNPMVKDILDLLKSKRTKDELLAELAKTYALGKDPGFSGKLDRFLDMLSRKGLLFRDGPPEPGASAPGGAENRAKAFCQKNNRLWQASFELTFLCNEKCRHCYLDDYDHNRDVGFLRFPVWKKAIDEIADMGCMRVLVTGGEPTLHPDFLEFCRHVVARGMLLDIYTNGLAISNSLFDAIVALHPNSVSFSLYGATPSFHDWVTRVPGSFERTLKTMLMFKCAGVDVFAKSILLKGHADETVALHALCDRVGIRLLCAQVVLGSRLKSNGDLNADGETLAEYFRMRAPVDPFWAGAELPRRNADEPICSLARSGLAFSPDGAITPCLQFPVVLGNVARDSIRQVWESSPQLETMRNWRFGDVSPECASCPDSGYCNVCPAVAWEESGRLAPCSYSCRHARLKRGLFLSGELREIFMRNKEKDGAAKIPPEGERGCVHGLSD